MVLLALPTLLRAEYVDDLKTEVAQVLPMGTHQDKVRQFLKVRSFKITELPKEKKFIAKATKGGLLKSELLVTVTFEFDDGGLLRNVRYEVPEAAAKP